MDKYGVLSKAFLIGVLSMMRVTLSIILRVFLFFLKKKKQKKRKKEKEKEKDDPR